MRTPGEKAAAKAAKSIAALDTIVAGLAHANRLLEKEQEQATAAHAHHTELAKIHANRAWEAQQAAARHSRIAGRVADLLA